MTPSENESRRVRGSADDPPSAGHSPRSSACRDVSAVANAAVVTVLNAFLISHSFLVTAAVALVAIALAFALG